MTQRYDEQRLRKWERELSGYKIQSRVFFGHINNYGNQLLPPIFF